LIEQQHDDIRRAVLGDVAAVERLRAIEVEVKKSSESLRGYRVVPDDVLS
jgi:hypothetical protein